MRPKTPPTPPGVCSRRARSRSRSRPRSPLERHQTSRSRRESNGNHCRSPSYSPPNSRYEHQRPNGTRDNPTENRCLGVFGLSDRTTQSDIKRIFSKYGPLRDVNLVYDNWTGRSRGYCFVYYESLRDAIRARESCSDLNIDSRHVRVDYSITQCPRAPGGSLDRYRDGAPSFGKGRRYDERNNYHESRHEDGRYRNRSYPYSSPPRDRYRR